MGGSSAEDEKSCVCTHLHGAPQQGTEGICRCNPRWVHIFQHARYRFILHVSVFDILRNAAQNKHSHVLVLQICNGISFSALVTNNLFCTHRYYNFTGTQGNRRELFFKMYCVCICAHIGLIWAELIRIIGYKNTCHCLQNQ